MKALILTTHTGGGHDAAAHALEEALTARGAECRVMDCVAFGGAWLSKVVSGTYVKWVQHTPGSFGRIYRFGKLISTPRLKSPIYMINSTYAFRMEKVLEEFQPDVIVCTHIFGGQSVTHLKLHGQFKGLLAIVMTDYTLHPFTEDCQADVLFVGHHDMVQECRDKGFAQAAVKPYGIPVSPKCRPCEDKTEAKRAAGLDPEKRQVLLVGGSMGAGNLPGTIGGLLPVLGENDHLTVVCGSNKAAMEKAQSLYGNDSRVTVLGRVSPLYPLMAAADVLLTKSGGLTTSEAMTIGVPMVIVYPIPGCETSNAAFFEKYRLASYARQPEEIPGKVAALLKDETARKAMVDAQRREIDPNAADHIASCLIDMTNEK